jgi:hypothetical protein
MPRAKPLWAYAYSPWNLALETHDGKEEYLPTLSVIVYDSGANGAVYHEGEGGRPGTYDVHLADAAIAQRGIVAIPQDLEVEAWGKRRSSYIGREDGTPYPARATEGQPPEYWPSAWEKISIIHGRLKIEYDQAGFLAFRRKIAKMIGEISQDQKDGAQIAAKR